MIPRKRHSTKTRVEVFMRAGGRCHRCGGRIQAGERWELDHVIARGLDGEDDPSNLAPVHKACHRRKTAEQDIPAIAKARRREARHIGAWRSKRPLPGGKDDVLKKKISGEVVRREP